MDRNRRPLVWVLVVSVLVASVAAAVFFAARGRSSMQTSKPSLVASALAGVQTARPGEFPTPESAVRYLVEQVRTQNVDAAARVLPIASFYRRMTFRWQTMRLSSVSSDSVLFPRQPFSNLYSQLGMLQQDYVMFTVGLLVPDLASRGTVINVSSSAQERRLEAQLDPSRLRHISITTITPTYNFGGAKFYDLRKIGVTRVAGTHVVIGGIGAPRGYDIDTVQIGGNWLIRSVERS